MTQLDRLHQCPVQGDEDGHLHQDRQTATERVDLLLLVQLHHALGHLLAIVTEAFLERSQLGLQHAHLGHGGVLGLGQREHDAAYQQGQHDDGQAPVLDETVEHGQQPVQRLGDEPEPAVVDGQVQVVCHLGHLILQLGTDPQLAAHFGLLTGSHVNQRRLVAYDGLVFTRDHAAVEAVGVLGVRCPGRDEVVLQHGDPTTLGGLVQVGILHLVEGVLLVAGIFAGEGTTTVGAGHHGMTFLVLRRGHGLLQLTIELHLNRLGRLVVDLVIDADGVVTALEHELLGEDDALAVGPGHRYDDLILTVGQLVAGLGGFVGGTTLGLAVRTIATHQTTLGNIEVRRLAGQQGERLFLAFFQLVGQQFGRDDVTALGIQGQLEHVGGDGDKLACGSGVGLLGNLRNITGLTGFRYEMFGLGHGSRGRLRSLVGLPLLPEQEAHEQQTDQE
ncbi:hypothetical protein D3C71_612850 [compost metagenome]